MAYDENFYKLYGEYLEEPRVRQVHRFAVKALARHPDFDCVLDIGCGRHNEFLSLRGVTSRGFDSVYVGVDQNAGTSSSEFVDLWSGDYRANDGEPAVKLAALGELHSAVSLFSTECTAPEPVNRALYERLLTETPIRRLLVSGFYYEHAAGEETVGEAGGLVSYQTIAPIEACKSDAYVETRLTLPCPSLLFGEDVIEVWRLLVRR